MNGVIIKKGQKLNVNANKGPSPQTPDDEVVDVNEEEDDLMFVAASHQSQTNKEKREYREVIDSMLMFYA